MRLRHAAWLLAPLSLLTLAGCSAGAPIEESANDATQGLGVQQGVDYSWARPSPAGLRAAGYTFAARYLSGGQSGKNISHGEADALIAAGVDVVLVWEQGATDALGGYGRGQSDAQQAAFEAAAAGMPDDRPIYFAVDFDAQPNQQGALDAYFDGVASVIGRDRTGAYGGLGVIQRSFDDGRIAWGWQTYAWSYGHWDPRAQVRQTHNGVDVAGGQCDLDVAMVADFGQWGNANPPPPPPQGPPTAVPAAPSGCGTIDAGQGLVAGQAFGSCDGRFQLAMQTDGNFVLYEGGQALWATHTDGSDGFAATFQGDGNLVVYGQHSNPLWASGTDGHPGSRLVLQDDGNLVIYGPGNQPLWASNTVVGAAPPPPPPQQGCGVLVADEALAIGASATSCGGAYTLVMQGDGNLVLYHNGVGAIWATNTDQTSGAQAIQQSDGNFVLYASDGKALWNSHTEGHAGAFLAVQDDGNLVVYGPGNQPLWASNTNGK